MKKRTALITLCFLCMIIVSGCTGSEYSSQEKKALEAKGKKLAQAYLDEHLPGAECLSARAVTAGSEGGPGPAKLTDYVSGKYWQDNLTYDYYFNVSTKRMFTSRNFSFCRIRLSGNVFKELGIEPDQTKAFASASDYFLYLPDIPKELVPLPVEAVPMEAVDDVNAYVDDPDRKEVFEVSMEICVDDGIELDFDKFSLDRFYNGAAARGIYFKNLTIHHTLSVIYDRIGYGGTPTITDRETFTKRGEYGRGNDTAVYELWDDVQEDGAETHKVIYRKTEHLEPDTQEIRVREEDFRQADQAQGQNLNNEASANRSKEAYERFLNDQEPIYFDKWNLDGEWLDDKECYGDRFRNNTPYRFEEVIDLFVQHVDVIEGGGFKMGRVEYAYIDCGADKIPELALRIADYRTSVGVFSEVYVIKLIDSKLQLCYSFDYGYRTEAGINEYGYIVDEGSTGAASFARTDIYINADGEEKFVLNVDAQYMQYDDLELALEAYSFKPFSAYADYDGYEKDMVRTYWIVDDHGDWLEDESAYPYCEYIGTSSVTYYSHAEVEKKINGQREKLGITDTILNGREPEWTVLTEAPEVIEPVVIKNPGWEYYCEEGLTESASHISLKKVSQEANGIIDENDWFSSIGITMPDRNDQSYDDYYFHMHGDDELGYYHNMLEISDSDGEKIADLDFSEFYMPDSYIPADAMFVSEAIYGPKIADGILYISSFHKTYAASAPHNGYIMAIDMNDDYRVLWKTEPLTCNADNFEIVGDTIICGYGFTNEDDFIYLLDKNTGKRIDTIKVKTGPEYFHVMEDTLYVRTYDTNYEFKINR